MTHEELRAEADKVEAWPTDEANRIMRIASQMFTRHECQGSRLIEMRENCQACCLVKGEMSATKRQATRNETPNVAGWLRDYIQNGRRVRLNWLQQEIAHAQADNQAYYNAILRDIKTFGLVS